jgi:hypothetical protein
MHWENEKRIHILGGERLTVNQGMDCMIIHIMDRHIYIYIDRMG